MSSRKNDRPQAEALPANWHDFLTRRIVPASSSLDNAGLNDHVRSACGSILKGAEEDKILPASTLLAQLHSVPPPGIRFNFSLPEVVRRDRQAEVHEAASRLASFVRRDSNASFFRSAISQGGGVLWIVSSFERPDSVPVGDLVTVTTRVPANWRPAAPPVRPQTASHEWDYKVRDLSRSEVHPEPSPALVLAETIDLPAAIRRVLGASAPRYMEALRALVGLGEVVFCVPSLFDTDHDRRVGGGGLFVFEEPCSLDDLRGIHALTHRLATVFGDAFQNAEWLARREAEQKLSEGFAMLHHSLGNAIEKGLRSGDDATHVGRILLLEQFALEAALLYADSKRPAARHRFNRCGFEKEPFWVMLEEVKGTRMRPLTIHVRDGLDKAEFDALALCLLVECCRNATKHRHVAATVTETVVLEKDPLDSSRFRICLETLASAGNMLALETSLLSEDSDSARKSWILRLAKRVSMDDAKALVSWSFAVDAEPLTTFYRSNWKLSKPSLPKTDARPLRMTLTVGGLLPYRSSASPDRSQS